MSTFLSFSTVYSRLLYRVERSTIKRRCQIQESHFRRSLFSCFVSLFLDSSFFFIFLPFTASFLPRISSFKLNKGATSPIIHSKLNNITLSKYFSNYHFLSSLSSLKKIHKKRNLQVLLKYFPNYYFHSCYQNDYYSLKISKKRNRQACNISRENTRIIVSSSSFFPQNPVD